DLQGNGSSVGTLIATVTIDVLLATIAIAKGKLMLGMIGIFIPITSVVGSVRLASPTSWWARRFYRPGSKRLARSQARWTRIESRREFLEDAIAGTPSEEPATDAAPHDSHSAG